ncbi:MAG: NAD(P)-dependent oxidoreductase [Terrimicrobiaceae bacterium]
MERVLKVGLVGVGRMGANMARRLHECGWNVVVVADNHAEAARQVSAELGCQAAEQLADVSALADVVITVVSDDAAMREIFGLDGGKDHLLLAASGRLFINCATISPGTHEEVDAAVQAAGGSAIEACMASSITQAREGKLYLMVAGAEEDIARAAPVLSDLSSNVLTVGKTGEAAKVKALVNMVMNTNTAALAEGLGLGAALGLDLTMLRQVFAGTGANSRVLETDGEDMQNRDHACFFSAAHAAKDSGIALALAREAGLNLPVASASHEQYLRMVALGLGDLDKSGIAELTFPGRKGSGAPSPSLE